MLKKKRSVLELFVVTVLVILCLGLSVGIFAGRTKVQKGRLLMQELAMLRASVSLFSMRNDRLPKDFSELEGSTYEIAGVEKHYVEFFDGANRQLIDPFGNPYKYHPKDGWVSSVSEGYERW